MGDNKEVTTNEPSNPDVQPTLSRILQGVRSNIDNNPTTQPMTEQGWYSQLSAANNPNYARGVNGATSELADIASGSRFGMNDPGYAALRSKVADDVGTASNALFTTSGRFGSGSHAENFSEGLSNALSGMDYANFQNDQQRQMGAISALPGAFAAGQAPGQVQQSVGQQQQAQPWYNLGQASSVLSGTAGAGGNTTTQPGAPWWQAPVAIGGTLASAFF